MSAIAKFVYISIWGKISIKNYFEESAILLNNFLLDLSFNKFALFLILFFHYLAVSLA